MLKSNNKVLFIVLIVLLIIWLGREFLTNKGQSNFDNQILNINKELVSEILISPKSGGHEIKIMRSGSSWEIRKNGVSDEADVSVVEGMINSIHNLRAERLVGKSKDSWEKYEVDEEKGTRVKFYDGKTELADVLIGKNGFQQTVGKSIAYLRKQGESEVYAVSGHVASNFTKDFKYLRDRTFIYTNKEDIRKIQFHYPLDSGFILSQVEGNWMIDNYKADSVQVDRFLNGLRNISNSDFNDHFRSDGKSPAFEMTLEGEDMEPIEVKAYLDEQDGLILHSSQNSNSWFGKGTLDVFKKLFVSKSDFSAIE